MLVCTNLRTYMCMYVPTYTCTCTCMSNMYHVYIHVHVPALVLLLFGAPGGRFSFPCTLFPFRFSEDGTFGFSNDVTNASQ